MSSAPPPRPQAWAHVLPAEHRSLSSSCWWTCVSPRDRELHERRNGSHSRCHHSTQNSTCLWAGRWKEQGGSQLSPRPRLVRCCQHLPSEVPVSRPFPTRVHTHMLTHTLRRACTPAHTHAHTCALHGGSLPISEPLSWGGGGRSLSILGMTLRSEPPVPGLRLRRKATPLCLPWGPLARGQRCRAM